MFVFFFFFFFFADPAILLPFKKENKIFIPTDPKMFQEIRQKKNFKNVRIAKLMLRIIFFNFLDVLNFIICIPSSAANATLHLILNNSFTI